MDKREIYEMIREELLKDENIWSVETDSINKLVLIKPNKNNVYLLVTDVLRNFRTDTCFTICQKHFVLYDYDLNYDNWMLEIKEVC